jgi:hypothetical protein
MKKMVAIVRIISVQREYVWATIETMKQTLMVYYKDENLVVKEIKRFGYEIGETVHNRKDSIFKSGS